MSSTHDEQSAEEGERIYRHPVLCELQDRDGQYGPFINFKLSRPFLHPRTGESVPSNWHTLNQKTLDHLRWVLDDLQEKLDAETAKKKAAGKKNGKAARKAGKPTRKKASIAAASR